MAVPIPNYRHNNAVTASLMVPSSSHRSRAINNMTGSCDRNRDPVSIFKHKNHGNLAFSPQKSSKSMQSRGGVKSQLPEMPLPPYKRYENQVWASVKSSYPDHKMWELTNIISDMWSKLVHIEKQVYIVEYDKDKREYDRALRSYKASTTPHQVLVATKYKSKPEVELHTSSQRQERRVDIQPAEDEEDDDDGNCHKHFASYRYARNNALIQEIFSDAVVPDVRSVVTTQRMQVLKRQVSSLTMHQTKLESELQQMEDRHEIKKQKMHELSTKFQEELERHCRPAVTEETIQKMADRMYEDMKRERQRLARVTEEVALSKMENNHEKSEEESSVPTIPNANKSTEEAIEPTQIIEKIEKNATSTLVNECPSKSIDVVEAESPVPKIEIPNLTEKPEKSVDFIEEKEQKNLKETKNPANPENLPPQVPHDNILATANRSPYYHPQYGTHPAPSAYAQTNTYAQYQQAPYGAPPQFVAPQYFNVTRPQQQNIPYEEGAIATSKPTKVENDTKESIENSETKEKMEKGDKN